MTKEERKRYAQLDKELTILTHKLDIIVARYKKAIWMDVTFDKDRKDILRNAELTIRLADDFEYQTLLLQLWELEAQQKEIGDIFDL